MLPGPTCTYTLKLCDACTRCLQVDDKPVLSESFTCEHGSQLLPCGVVVHRSAREHRNDASQRVLCHCPALIDVAPEPDGVERSARCAEVLERLLEIIRRKGTRRAGDEGYEVTGLGWHARHGLARDPRIASLWGPIDLLIF